MLVDAKSLTGYVRKGHQVRWLKNYGFVEGKNWYEQKNGKIVVNLAESITPEPVVTLNLSALGPQKTIAKAPAAKTVSKARQVSVKAS